MKASIILTPFSTQISKLFVCKVTRDVSTCLANSCIAPSFHISLNTSIKCSPLNHPFIIALFGQTQIIFIFQATGLKRRIGHSLLLLLDCGIHYLQSSVHLHHHSHSMVVSRHICTGEGFGSECLFFGVLFPLLGPLTFHSSFHFSFSLLLFYVKYSFFYCSYEANCLRAMYYKLQDCD